MILTQHGINSMPTSDDGGKVIIDGKSYKTVMLGSHEWMAENLASDSFGGRWYNNDAATYSKYGKLYKYTELAAINSGVPGWHIPTIDETEEMFADLLGISLDTPNRKQTAYNRKDELLEGFKSTHGWDSSAGNGTNAYGFNLLPNGAYYYYGDTDNFRYSGTNFYLWLGYYQTGQNYYWYNWTATTTTISGQGTSYDMSYGVRLIKDS